ncbi:MAG: lipocalin family protein [Fluviicola sp.]|jgi:hypothetical protein
MNKQIIGKWTVEGVICTTEMEALKNQLEAQEKTYNDAYKNSVWVFNKEGSIEITLPKSEASPGGKSSGQFQIQGEKVLMEVNNQYGEYEMKFEDGQMVLINSSPLNTIYYVFIKQ